MTYGQGVNYNETLPYQLESQLNRAFWSASFEVINAGVSGHSFYHGWQRVVELNELYRPDLTVFVICDNDTELLGNAEHGLDYGQHVQMMWEQEGDYFPYFIHALDSFEQDIKARQIQCLLAYYYIYPPPSPNDPSIILQETCANRIFDFVDISTEFNGPQAASSNQSLRVGPADGHPSASAHRIAARRLAREIVSLGCFGEDKLKAEKVVLSEVMGAIQAMFAAGRNPAFALNWGMGTLDSKRFSLKRDKLEAEDLLGEADYRAVVAQLSEMADIHKELLSWEGYADRIRNEQERFWLRFTGLHYRLLQWNKKCFVQECNLRDPALRYRPFSKLDDTTRMRRDDAKIAEKLQAIKGAKKLLKSLPIGSEHQGMLGGQEFQSRKRSIWSGIEPFWREAERLFTGSENAMRRLEQLNKTSTIIDGGSAAIDEIAALSSELYGIVADLAIMDIVLDVPKNNARMPSSDVFWNDYVEIELVSEKPRWGTVTLRLYGQVPRFFISEQWNVSDLESRQVARFCLPYFSRGQLEIAVHDGGAGFKLQCVTLYHGAQRPVNLEFDSDGSVYRTRIVTLPL